MTNKRLFWFGKKFLLREGMQKIGKVYEDFFFVCKFCISEFRSVSH